METVGHHTKWEWPTVRVGPSDAEKITLNGPVENGDFTDGVPKEGVHSSSSDVDSVFNDLQTKKKTSYSCNKLAKHNKVLTKLMCLTPTIEDSNTSIEVENSNSFNGPSSPMITALRDAVSSLNRMEDFEVIQKIGEGFYAEVFKVVIHPRTCQPVCILLNMTTTLLIPGIYNKHSVPIPGIYNKHSVPLNTKLSMTCKSVAAIDNMVGGCA